MRKVKNLFMPLGIDHVVIACFDRHFWRQVLEKIGFVRVIDEIRACDTWKLELLNGAPLALGGFRVVLVDTTTRMYQEKAIYNFLLKHGDMQVYSIAVRVDDIQLAVKELSLRGFDISFVQNIVGDAWGDYGAVSMPHPEEGVWWRFYERESRDISQTIVQKEGLMGVDHCAIAVKNLDKWRKWYVSLGFRKIYEPKIPITSGQSYMKTVALRCGNWTVALVEGVDGTYPSQVRTYVCAHGDHSIQHIALRFNDLASAVGTLEAKQVRFRKKADGVIIHEGEDYGGNLRQCFTKPFTWRLVREEPVRMSGGLFFECIERAKSVRKAKDKQAFHDPTVIGLYESIEREEMGMEQGMILPEYEFRFDPRHQSLLTPRE